MNGSGYWPTRRLVGPIEFTLRAEDYAGLGGHVDSGRALGDVAAVERVEVRRWHQENPWPLGPGTSHRGAK